MRVNPARPDGWLASADGAAGVELDVALIDGFAEHHFDDG